MSRILYKSSKGYQIKNHSYSGGSLWDFCSRKYQYKKLDGWQEREDGPALAFGNSFEAAHTYYHVHGREKGSGVEEWKLNWFRHRDSPDIKYTDKSGTWEDLLRVGVEMMRLYEVTLPSLPIMNEEFQVKRVVDLFPHTPEYEGLGYDARADILCTVPNGHPLLPPLDGGPTRRLIIDVKTSGNPYPSDPRMSALDPQLIDYSWVFDIPTVAFLVFVKNPSGHTTGDWVTALTGDHAGKSYIAYDINEERTLVLPKTIYDEMSERKKEIKGKGSKERLESLEAEYFYRALRFDPQDLTKQKIQFLPAVIDQETRDDAHQVARNEAMEIADSYSANFFPKNPGIRFPNRKCPECAYRGLCLRDEALTKELLVKIDGTF